ncbi:MAG: GNAT family N-acetyltransferase [Candidatus Eiseniibacteriota bacterium]
MLKPLVSRHRDAAYAYLTERGLRDIFLASKIHEGALTFPDGAGQGRFLGAFDGEKLEGVLFLGHGGLVVFSAERPHARRLFAEEAWKERAKIRLLVGEWASVSDFWGHLEAAGFVARRDWREVFCEADRASLSPEREPRLRLAEASDLPVLVDLSARAYREETGEDPLAAMGEGYVRHVARNVEEARTFVLEDSGSRLVFKADLSARCPAGAQIVGVFTEPELRGRGIARRCTGEIVHRLLEANGQASGVSAVCLFVREDNAPARRAYERAGFVPSMTYRRLFVEAVATVPAVTTSNRTGSNARAKQPASVKRRS